MQATQLVASALRYCDVTCINISPALHTWATIAAQGCRVYAERQVIVVPALGSPRMAGRAVADPRGWHGLPEDLLLDDHAR